MKGALTWSLLLPCLLAAFAPAGDARYIIKTTTSEPPNELQADIAKLLSKEAVQLSDAQGNLIAEVWLRQSVPAEATPEQVKNGLTYREVPETTIFGAIRFPKNASDFRKQPVKAGVYTLRLGFQPQDGDHMGTSPHPEFCLLLAASKDTTSGTLEPKMMIEKSANSIGASHPAVLLLYPNNKPAARPELAAKPNHHFAINARLPVTIKGQKSDAVLGISLTVIGHASE